jgi:hypothetical protein
MELNGYIQGFIGSLVISFPHQTQGLEHDRQAFCLWATSPDPSIIIITITIILLIILSNWVSCFFFFF